MPVEACMGILRKVGCLALLLFSTFSTAYAQDAFVFAFPPRETASGADDVYGPIADFLTKVTGKKFVAHYVDNYLTYESEMRKGTYDLVLDGPQFVSWRMIKRQHTPLVRLDGNLVLAVAINKERSKAKTMEDLAGHSICALSPPNLATLAMLDTFNNPARQPYLVRMANFKQGYDYTIKGQCEALATNLVVIKKLDEKNNKLEVLYKSKPLPNQAFSASPRIPADIQQKIAAALLSPEGQAVTAKFRAKYGNKPLIAANPQEFEGLARLLKDVWGFAL